MALMVRHVLDVIQTFHSVLAAVQLMQFAQVVQRLSPLTAQFAFLAIFSCLIAVRAIQARFFACSAIHLFMLLTLVLILINATTAIEPSNIAQLAFQLHVVIPAIAIYMRYMWLLI
jgi:hypothetical protein